MNKTPSNSPLPPGWRYDLIPVRIGQPTPKGSGVAPWLRDLVEPKKKP